ncbi:MAG: Ig-like domain-containing protein, partial [Ignavibacteriales bacterium]
VGDRLTVLLDDEVKLENYNQIADASAVVMLPNGTTPMYVNNGTVQPFQNGMRSAGVWITARENVVTDRNPTTNALWAADPFDPVFLAYPIIEGSECHGFVIEIVRQPAPDMQGSLQIHFTHALVTEKREGDILATFYASAGSGFTSGACTIGRFVAETTIAACPVITTMTSQNTNMNSIFLAETAPNILEDYEVIKFELPAGFSWDNDVATPPMLFSPGGFVELFPAHGLPYSENPLIESGWGITDDGRSLLIHMPWLGERLEAGRISILNMNVKINDLSAVQSGDVAVAVSSDLGNVTSQSLVIANLEYVPVTSISLNTQKLYLLPNGNSEQLIATVLPENATIKTLVWSSNNEKVATVDSQGVVTSHARGTAIVTAKTSLDTCPTTCEVIVGGYPDLTVSQPVVIRSLFSGSRVTISSIVSNRSVVKSPSATLKIYFVNGETQTLISEKQIAEMAPLNTRLVTVQWTIPAGTPQGTYRIRAVVEPIIPVHESNTANNTAEASLVLTKAY